MMRRTFANWGGRPWWFWRRLADRRKRREAYSPLDLGSTLLAWWDASQGVTVSGSAVTAWRDRRNGYVVAQGASANRPTWSATGFNGAPGLTFDGTDDYLELASTPATFPTGSAGCEFWVVAQQSALPADTTVRHSVSYGDVVTDRRFQSRFVSGGVNRTRTGAGNGTTGVAGDETTIDLSSRHVIRSQFTATTVGSAVDSSALNTAAAVPATNLGRLRIGAAVLNPVANYWQGKIRDVIVTKPLTSDQATALRTFLLARRML